MLGGLAQYFSARAELVGLEGREAASNYLRLLVFLVIGLAAMVAMMIFLIITLVILVQWWTQWSWPAVTGSFAGAGLLVAVISTLAVKRRVSQPVFIETLAELRKDRAWLSRVFSTAPPPTRPQYPRGR